MDGVLSALSAGKAALAISGSLLRDADVLLALSARGSLQAMALSGPAVSPLVPVTDAALSRATAAKGGLLVIVEPESADLQGCQALVRALSKAANKPKILVVSRQFNPFAFASLMPGFQAEHLKNRGKQFIESLPVQDAPPAPVGEPAAKAPAAPKPGEANAPKPVFIGREDELAALGGLLAEAGPICVSGPAGIGKSYLVDRAIEKSGLKRLPDLVLGRGTGADALAARLAEIAKLGGSSIAADHLASAEKTPATVAQALVEALQASDTGGQVLVVRELQYAIGREGDFFRKGRLELWLQTLLTATYPLRIVFLSTIQPLFYREGAGASLRRLPVEGLKGREYYDLFQAYKAPEFPRDKIGPLVDKIHGHPLAIRTLATLVRDRQDGLELLDNPKFLKAESAADLDPLVNQLQKRLEKLSPELRESLGGLAHLRMPVSANTLVDLGVGRKVRIELLGLGLLEQSGHEADRVYRVHPLVRAQLSLREVYNFDVCATLSEYFVNQAKGAEGVEKLALSQEANRFGAMSRQGPKLPLSYPDNDAIVESAFGLLRGQSPNFQLAHDRIQGILKRDGSNAEAWIQMIELLQRTDSAADALDAVCADAMAKAPVPEVFHQVVGVLLNRKARSAAISALEKGVEALPNESRLRTRLASLMLKQGRRPEAIEQLQKAMELDPMLPDAYGILGMARRDEGVGSLVDAEALLREAVRLAPQDAVQVSRLVSLLLEQARVAEDPKPLREQARLLLEEVFRDEHGKTAEIHLLLATVHREEGNLERAGWFLKKARKLSEQTRDRGIPLRFEQALLDILVGDLDAAEAAIRDLVKKEPHNPRVFAALAQVLEARLIPVAAHAEMKRALERAPAQSLKQIQYGRELERLQKIIEAQAAGLVAELSNPAREIVPIPSAPRTILRKSHHDETPEEGTAEGAEVEAAPAEEHHDSPEAGADRQADDLDDLL